MATVEELRKKFRPELFVKDIHQVVDQDPNFRYKNVIVDYTHESYRRVERYINAGWEIVMTTSPTKDDRSFTPNSKDEKLRPQPCITTTQCGHNQLLMRILKTTDEENQLKKKADREALRARMSREKGERTEIRNGNVVTTGSESVI